MSITVRSFAKINLGLCIGGLRPDGFHELRTLYQTIALHDLIHLEVGRGKGIEIRSQNASVPTDRTNTCYRILEIAIDALKTAERVTVEIEKKLPVQGGLGGASANAVASLLALQIALKKKLPLPEQLRIASEVGSDLPLFLIGGTVLGLGRGEEVYPVPDLPAIPCVIATPKIGVSTPQAFADWDRTAGSSKLTASGPSDRMKGFSRNISSWLNSQSQGKFGKLLSGVPVKKGRVRAETSLLDLVRTGIENDFEKVVFPEYPELREIKNVMVKAGAFYASLSGSGSAIYGLFESRSKAERASARLRKFGVAAQPTNLLTRQQYWKDIRI